MVVVWVVVVIGEVPAMNIVDETVSIVVFTVYRDFNWVGPHICF
jgi:hypothetical protein